MNRRNGARFNAKFSEPAYIDLTETTSTNLNFFLATLVASCSATRELSVSASCTISCILPSNSLPTRSVTLSLGVKPLETFCFFAAFIGCTITTSETVSCVAGLIAGAGGSDPPNSAWRISSSVSSVFIPFSKGVMHSVTDSISVAGVCSRWVRHEALEALASGRSFHSDKG
ncbi:hypothetical protein PS938_01257 [Pseudomonas fluorescens]|uniref:Uncharacterized protein n=1 Tax=Pseudomonas fluorescens TaxID=294 RepID=A0A5E7SLL4_PSEFL|nr:hypothetical protein PS938_01257 [Pseudomonas fluorescens]